jgi:hypothetical protein
LPVMFYLSCSDCPFRLFFHLSPAMITAPLLSCHNSPVLSVTIWPSCPLCPVPDIPDPVPNFNNFRAHN